MESNKVYLLLLSSGLNETLSKFATAQAAHETGGFTSAIFKSNNNCFGMKYAHQVNAQGEKNGYADYKGIENSVADLVAWITRHRLTISVIPFNSPITTIEQYVSFLKSNGYFEAKESEYLRGCKYFYDKIFNK
jgi:hypothetical protein